MAKLKLPFELEKPSANEYVTQASEIGHDNKSVAEELEHIDITLYGTSHESDITSDADFQLRGYWLNDGVLGTSTQHYVSKTMHFNAGDVISFYCKTGSGSLTYLMYIAPTSADLSADDTRTFVGVGTKVKSTDGWNTQEYVVENDCYMLFESNTGMQLIVTPASNGSMVEDVATLKSQMSSANNTLTNHGTAISENTSDIASLETVVGRDGVKEYTINALDYNYTQFRNENGGHVKITITTATSGTSAGASIGVNIKASATATEYLNIGNIANTVGAVFETDLGASTDGKFYIRLGYSGIISKVEWIKEGSSTGLCKRVEDVEESVSEINTEVDTLNEVVGAPTIDSQTINTLDYNYTQFRTANGGVVTVKLTAIETSGSAPEQLDINIKASPTASDYVMIGKIPNVADSEVTIALDNPDYDGLYYMRLNWSHARAKVDWSKTTYPDSGVSKDVATLKNIVEGSTPEITTGVVSAYTKFRSQNGGKVKISITAAASGQHNTLGLYVKTSPSASSYLRLGDIANTVGAKAEFDLGVGTTYNEYFYIKNDYGATMDVEWQLMSGIVEKIENISESAIQMPFNNYPLPRNPQTLKILTLGNSFSEALYSNILGLLSAANITGVTLARTYSGGASLEQQISWFDSLDANREFYVSENGAAFTKLSSTYTIEDALNYAEWDIIITHEQSARSGLIEYYDKYLPAYINRIRSHPKAAKAKIAWQLTWKIGNHHYIDDYYHGSQDEMFNGLLNVYKALKEKFGLDLVIPNHISFENARQDSTLMSITGINELMSSDELHPNSYGNYLASATFFQQVFTPIYGIPLRGNSYRNTYITDDNFKRFQTCAILACSYVNHLLGRDGEPTIDNYITQIGWS